jgi:hypothetical protein
MRVGGQRHVPAALSPGMIRYPLYRRLGGPQGRSGRVLKISLPPFLFACPGFFPFDPFLYSLNPFRPSCHFTFHATVLTSNTTQTSMPPGGFEPSERAAADPRLRPHGHWDRQFDPRTVQLVASRYTD